MNYKAINDLAPDYFTQSLIIHSFIYYAPIQSQWPSFSFLNTPSWFLSQGLCTCSILCLESLSPAYLHGQLLQVIHVSAQISSFSLTSIQWLYSPSPLFILTILPILFSYKIHSNVKLYIYILLFYCISAPLNCKSMTAPCLCYKTSTWNSEWHRISTLYAFAGFVMYNI